MKVQLTYFKPSGKYCSDSVFDMIPTSLDSLSEIWDAAERRQKDGNLPGLVEDSGREFFILVGVPDHPHDHPKLILPLEVER